METEMQDVALLFSLSLSINYLIYPSRHDMTAAAI